VVKLEKYGDYRSYPVYTKINTSSLYSGITCLQIDALYLAFVFVYSPLLLPCKRIKPKWIHSYIVHLKIATLSSPFGFFSLRIIFISIEIEFIDLSFGTMYLNMNTMYLNIAFM